jgi:Flp pilus assembly protein TadG
MFRRRACPPRPVTRGTVAAIEKNVNCQPSCRRTGTVTAVVAICMPVLIGVTALGLDGSLIYLQRRQAQSIADGAAMAGAYQLYLSSSNTSGAATAATSFASTRGATNTTVSTPPTSGVFAGKSNYIEVTLSITHPRMFSGLWGSGTMTATATSIARGGGTQPYSTSSVILLDSSTSGSLTVAGGSQLNSSAAIQVNSSSTTAVNVNNGAQINASLNIVGGDTVTGGSQINGTVTKGVSTVSDPLASVPAPGVPTATSTPLSNYQGWGSFTMQPGLYSGNVSLGNGGTFTMQPGLYYIQGGSFTVANGATLTGSGVTIYVDNGGGSISFQGGTSTTLTPQTSGTYAGMVYFQNRSSSVAPQFGNGSSVSMKGTFYAAGAPLTFNGGTSYSQLSSQVVVKDINISNGSQINVPYSSSTVAGGTSSFGLVQ